ncbi:1-deoxy-D-xylulose-5-phosphate reductoisomerase [Paenibacillus sp. HJGM_3]|uniref:1-deoxy-D-xylulose-5-phosphate reductoisomerase n=1 Tax=Paenibacillus sp. HJGM_3 TaxID=3379816 RepID=UPI00385EE983
MKRIAVLGSTGSIGTQTLDVIAHHPEQFRLEALAAGSNVDLVVEQIRRFRPKLVSMADRDGAERVKQAAGTGVRVVYGEEGLIEAAAATDAELVVTAMVGSQGLGPTLAAIEAGKHIGLANKETLVSAGHLVTAAARRTGVMLLPVDSEHSAIFQCLHREPSSHVRKIVLTASGGSFRDKTRDQLEGVTVKEALAHPNWSMGAKITIDSATMANKGLEVIEAHWLFGLDYDRIEVLIHPESIIHSFVEFKDKSILAQMGMPDMRVPIQYALTYPERLDSPAASLDLTAISRLNFRAMDYDRFPMLRIAFECGRLGGTAPTVYNAANEVAVARFLQGDIDFLHIETIVERLLDGHTPLRDPSLEEIAEHDRLAREAARRMTL